MFHFLSFFHTTHTFKRHAPPFFSLLCGHAHPHIFRFSHSARVHTGPGIYEAANFNFRTGSFETMTLAATMTLRG